MQKICDEMDLQRANQAYMDFFPTLSLYAIIKSQIRDFGFKPSSDVGVMADFMHPSDVGLEYYRGERTDNDGETGNANRLLIGVNFGF